MTDEQMNERNEQLAAMSSELFGDAMRLQVVRPQSLTLLKDNARFFKRETFRQLRDNVAADKRLSSVPLCYRYHDGHLEVLSGNHRVQAATEAGLEHILVLVITEELEKSKRIAIQLSHNSLVGEDDQSILANLWAQIDSTKDQLYSGLDSDLVHAIDEVELVCFSTPSVAVHMVSFMFTDGEKEKLERIMEEMDAVARKSGAVFTAPSESYENFMKIVSDTKYAEKVRDSSLAMNILMNVCRDWLNAHSKEA